MMSYPGPGSIRCFFWFLVSSLLMRWPESGGWSDVMWLSDALLDRALVGAVWCCPCTMHCILACWSWSLVSFLLGALYWP